MKKVTIMPDGKNYWNQAQSVCLQVADTIQSGFDIGFDERIPADVQNTLRSFVSWVETNYRLPITLWVDFEYRHYLIRRDGKRVGYLFYWSDFSSYPAFSDIKDIPMIRLPVRTEHSSMEEILFSFIEAIFCYFAWICNDLGEDAVACTETQVNEILQAYLRTK